MTVSLAAAILAQPVASGAGRVDDGAESKSESAADDFDVILAAAMQEPSDLVAQNDLATPDLIVTFGVPVETGAVEVLEEPDAVAVLSDAQFAALLAGTPAPVPPAPLEAIVEKPDSGPLPASVRAPSLAAILFQPRDNLAVALDGMTDDLPKEDTRAATSLRRVQARIVPERDILVARTVSELSPEPKLALVMAAATADTKARTGGPSAQPPAPNENTLGDAPTMTSSEVLAEYRSDRALSERVSAQRMLPERATSAGLSAEGVAEDGSSSNSAAVTASPSQAAIPLDQTVMTRPSPVQIADSTSTTPDALVARHVAHQMVVAVMKTHEHTTEIQLDPEELGRVKLSLQTGDATILVVIQADRPETADLMRRNVEQLAQEFRSLGYQDVSFSFSRGQDRTGSDTPGAAGNGDPANGPPSESIGLPAPNQQRPAPAGHLDLRL